MAAIVPPDNIPSIPRAAGPGDDDSHELHPSPYKFDGRVYPEVAVANGPVKVQTPEVGKRLSGVGQQERQVVNDDELNRILNIPPQVLPVPKPDGSNSLRIEDSEHARPAAEQSVKVQGGEADPILAAESQAATVEPSERHTETLVVIPTHYVFIFSNPRSGNQQGLPLVQMNIQHYRMRDQPHVQVQLYDFLDLNDRAAGLKYLSLLIKKQKSIKEVHVWSAGGDGTLMGVVEGMIDMGIDINDPRVLFSVIPFGTGNDLSQVLGWGRYVPGTDVAGHHLEGLNHLVMQRLNGHKTMLDIWEVELETEKDGWVRQAGKHEKQSGLKRKMSNYSSIGLQGRVGVGFEKNRRGSRFLNAWEYTKQSASVLVHGAPPVTDSVKGFEAGGEYFDLEGNKKLRVTHEPIELIIQNIPGMWGRHVDLWGVTEMSRSIIRDQRGPTDMTKWTPHTAYDGKLEVFGIGSLRSYLFKQFPWGRKRLQRVGQFPSPYTIHFHPNARIHAMIDGEFYEVYGAKTMTYRRIMQIPMVGSAPATSRLVRDMVEKRAEMPGPTGEGQTPGVDFEVGKTEYAEETNEDKRERTVSAEVVKSRSREGSVRSQSR